MAGQSTSKHFWAVALRNDDTAALSDTPDEPGGSQLSSPKDTNLPGHSDLTSQTALTAESSSFISKSVPGEDLRPSKELVAEAHELLSATIILPRLSNSLSEDDNDEVSSVDTMLDDWDLLPEGNGNPAIPIERVKTPEEEQIRISLIQAIETVIRDIVQQIIDATGPIQFPAIPRIATPSNPQAPSTLNRLPNAVFPSRNERTVRRFSVLLSLLSQILAALIDNVTVTLRDIYYKDKDLFREQKFVNYYVLRLARSFGVPRRALNVLAAAKGLVAGRFTKRDHYGALVNDFNKPEGVIVLQILKDNVIDLQDVSWILIIEKEATFQTLSSAQFYNHGIIGNGILVTGKGYPDILTRQFVHQLSNAHRTDQDPIPIFALVDYDPDGIAIMSTYKNGSKALANENATLQVPRVQWLGPKTSDLCSVGLDGIGLLDLTGRDRKLARKKLENWNVDEESKRELRVMLMLGYKAEIQQLSERIGGLEGWLEEKISKLKT